MEFIFMMHLKLKFHDNENNKPRGYYLTGHPVVMQ